MHACAFCFCLGFPRQFAPDTSPKRVSDFIGYREGLGKSRTGTRQAGTHLYSWVERGTVRVKCLAQEHNAMARPGFEPGPLDPESSSLTTKPPHLLQKLVNIYMYIRLFVL